MSLALKVARRFVATYFSVGDVILWGKWKNHRGKITAFGADHWGNPTITVEPIPLGRKQPKTMNLFHVWRADVKENAMKKLLEKQAGDIMDSTKRVVARYIKQAGIEMGRSYVSAEDNVRIHRSDDHFKIWDLTNAGKKGKKVESIAVGLTFYYKGDKKQWLDNMGKQLPSAGDFNAIVSLFKDLQGDYPNEISVTQYVERGIDVLPANSSPVTLTTDKGLQIKADPLDFSVKSTVEHTGPKGNKFNQDTLYWAVSKKDSMLFYTWLKANLSKANKMDINDMKKVWDSEGIKYDSH